MQKWSPSSLKFKTQKKKNIHKHLYKIDSLSNGYNKCVLKIRVLNYFSYKSQLKSKIESISKCMLYCE